MISEFLGFNGGPATNQKITTCSGTRRDPIDIAGTMSTIFATDWDSFVKSMGSMNQPPLNIVYADVKGNIGYYVTSHAPIRKKVP